MGKYILKRLLHGLISAVIVVLIVMVLIYSLLNRTTIMAGDPNYSKLQSNARITYEQSRYEAFGYQDYVPYADYLIELQRGGEITEEDRATAAAIGRTPEKDNELAAKYIQQFTETYEAKGYRVTRLDADVRRNGQVKDGGQAALYATKDIPLSTRAIKYFTEMFFLDNIHYVDEGIDIGERKLTFTWYDPVYNPTGTEGKFSPAIIGNGTMHKYLLYFDDSFPWIHQNFLTLHLGESYTVNRGIDVFTTMTDSQGSYVLKPTVYPDTGYTEDSADNLHSATYLEGSRELNPVYAARFNDDYTNVTTHKMAKSKLGFSFVNGIFSTLIAYCIGLPVGLLMARHKDGLLDKIGTVYIIFIIAVPSLAYIFLFKSLGGSIFKLPTLFDMDTSGTDYRMYILPIISLALPSIGNHMKWMRRYMIDQMNSDYVKFARSGGLSENEIFTKHIWKNAVIPITHGIPSSVIFAMTGAIITERVYSVPGAGNLLTQAINKYDNSVIVGVTLFYAVLSVIAITLGDVLMATVDPRISFTDKAR